jgi:hypothetical protein
MKTAIAEYCIDQCLNERIISEIKEKAVLPD